MAKQSAKHPRPCGRSRLRRFARFCFFAAMLAAAAVGFSLSGDDYAAMSAFVHGAQRWQATPEFRSIATEYCIAGSGSMRTSPFGVPVRKSIMAIRSIPGLPKEFAVNPTSYDHYLNFSRGPLSAYLHLCGEQTLPEFIPAVEELGRKSTLTPADYHAWLDQRQMDFPLAKDDGAARSLEMLVRDVEPGRPFTVRENIAPLLRPHIAAVAAQLGLPTEPEKMTSDQQQAVLERLDSYLRYNAHELWRSKQVNDFSGGIWAQVYGPPYNILMVPYLKATIVCRYVLAGMFLFLILKGIRARRKLTLAAASAMAASATPRASVVPASVPASGEAAELTRPLHDRPAVQDGNGAADGAAAARAKV